MDLNEINRQRAASREDQLDEAVRQWLRLPYIFSDGPPPVAIQKAAKRRTLSIWDRKAIAGRFHRMLDDKPPTPPDRDAREISINGDCKFMDLDVKAGDRFVFIPAERVRYPYAIQFPDGTEVLIEAPMDEGEV